VSLIDRGGHTEFCILFRDTIAFTNTGMYAVSSVIMLLLLFLIHNNLFH